MDPDATPCSQVDDLDIFTSTDKHDIAAAKAVCATCPATLKAACLTAALAIGEDGIWAGTTKTQRKKLGAANKPRSRRSDRKPIEHGTPQGYYLHRYRGEDACPECKKAMAEHTAQRRKTSKTQRNQEGTAA